MRPTTTGSLQTDSQKFASVPSVKPQDLLKLIEELRALKSRAHTIDLQRLEDSHRLASESAMKSAERRFKPGGPDLQKLQAEERRIADSKSDEEKALLDAKYKKLDAGLQALSQFIGSIGPVKELEATLAEKTAAMRKAEDELNVQRKVFAHEQDELDREKKLIDAAGQGLRAKEKELEVRAASLDVARRAKELDAAKRDLDGKLAAFKEQEQRFVRERQELNEDLERMGQKRAELDRETERIAQLSTTLADQKAKMAETVAKEMALTFESFVRDMLRPPPETPSSDENS
jgi:chromosome segregation ATPase